MQYCETIWVIWITLRQLVVGLIVTLPIWAPVRDSTLTVRTVFAEEDEQGRAEEFGGEGIHGGYFRAGA